VELGPGQGALARCFHQRNPSHQRSYTGVDLAPAPTGWPDAYRWRRLDACSLPDFNAANVLIGNFILHQFSGPQLAKLGEKMRESPLRLLAFNEPARSPLHQWQFRLLWPVINDVSRHDGAVSIRAGFRGNELPALLGLADGWRVTVQTTFLGAYRLHADRASANDS